MSERVPKNTQKKGLSTALKYFFGVGDAGFVLMSNVETFYFMSFLTGIGGFSATTSLCTVLMMFYLRFNGLSGAYYKSICFLCQSTFLR